MLHNRSAMLIRLSARQVLYLKKKIYRLFAGASPVLGV